MKKAITVLGLGAAAVAISVTNASALEQQEAQTSTSINLREQPSATSNKVSELQAGAKVTVKESQNGWANIQTEDGQGGWVSGYYVTDENGQSVVPIENTKVNPVAQSNVKNVNNNISNTGATNIANKTVSDAGVGNNVKNNADYTNINQSSGAIVEADGVEVNSNGRITSTPTLNLRDRKSTRLNS